MPLPLHTWPETPKRRHNLLRFQRPMPLLPIPRRSPLAPLAGRGAGGEGFLDRFLISPLTISRLPLHPLCYTEDNPNRFSVRCQFPAERRRKTPGRAVVTPPGIRSEASWKRSPPRCVCGGSGPGGRCLARSARLAAGSASSILTCWSALLLLYDSVPHAPRHQSAPARGGLGFRTPGPGGTSAAGGRAGSAVP